MMSVKPKKGPRRKRRPSEFEIRRRLRFRKGRQEVWPCPQHTCPTILNVQIALLSF